MKYKLHLSVPLLILFLSPVFAEPRLENANYYFDKGMKYQKQRQYSLAIKSLEKSMKIFQSVLGRDHTEIGRNSIALGLAYSRLKNYEKSRSYLNNALKIYRGRETPHRLILTAYREIGRTYFLENKKSLAIGFYQKGLSIALKFKSKNVREKYVYRFQVSLGYLYFYSHDYRKAIAYYKTALNSNTVKPYAVDYHRMGLSLAAIGSHLESTKYFQKQMNILRKKVPKNRVRIASVYHNIGKAYKNLKQYRKAIEYHEFTLKEYKVKYGIDNKHMYQINKLLAEEYQAVGNIKNAVKYYKKLLHIAKNQFGNRSPEVTRISAILVKLKH